MSAVEIISYSNNWETYLTYFNIVDSEFSIRMSLLGIEDLFDGDWTKSVSSSALESQPYVQSPRQLKISSEY
jgi:hypothetical protein